MWNLSQTKPLSSKNLKAYKLRAYSTVITRFHIAQTLKKYTHSAQDSQINLVTSIG